MKAKDLIKVLQCVDPESEVLLSLGHTDEYREQCAKAELMEGECLDWLSVDMVSIYPDEESDQVWAHIVLQQYNYPNIGDYTANFDEFYTKIGEEE